MFFCAVAYMVISEVLIPFIAVVSALTLVRAAAVLTRAKISAMFVLVSSCLGLMHIEALAQYYLQCQNDHYYIYYYDNQYT